MTISLLSPDWPAGCTLANLDGKGIDTPIRLTMASVHSLQPDHAEARIEISTVQMLVQQRKQQNPQGGQRLSVVKSSAQQSS